MGISYNLLPYRPNRENMKGVPFRDFRKDAEVSVESRLPSPQELRHVFEHSDYVVAEISNGEKFSHLFINDVYQTDGVYIDLVYSDEHLSISQATFLQALEIGQMICRKFGPYYFGYNGFDEVFLIDGSSDLNAIIDAPPTHPATLDYLERRYATELKEQSLPDLDPRIAEARSKSIYVKVRNRVADMLEEDMKQAGYARHGEYYYSHQGNFVVMITAIDPVWTSSDTFFLGATFYLMDKRRYAEANVGVPSFPEFHSFHKTIRFPERNDLKKWGYKNVTFDTITDMDWIENQQEEIRKAAGILPALGKKYVERTFQ